MNPFVPGSCHAFSFLLVVLSTSFLQAQTLDTAAHYRIASMGQAGKSVSVLKDGQKFVRPVMEATSADRIIQRWKWKLVGEGVFQIMNQQAGTDLVWSARQEATGIQVVLDAPTNASGQLWRLSLRPDGTTRISNEEFGQTMVLDIDTQGRLLLRQQNGLKTQLWKLILQAPTEAEINAKLASIEKEVVPSPNPATTTPQVHAARAVSNAGKAPMLDTAATYRIFTEAMPDKSLGMGNFDGKVYHAILLATRFHKEQEWKLRQTSEGFFLIVSNYNPKEALEVRRQGPEYEVVISSLTGAQTQQWTMTSLPDGAFQISSPIMGADYIWGFVDDGSEQNDVAVRTNHSTSWRLVRSSAAPVVAAKTIVVPAGKSLLAGQEELKANDQLVSPNGKYKLVQQGDGNLVLYNQAGIAIWASNTNGKAVKRCVMQKDGNFVQYLAYEVPLWSTNTHGNAGAFLSLQDDGNLVIYSKDNRALWASNTAGK